MARHFNGTASDFIDLGTANSGAGFDMIVQCWVNIDDTAAEYKAMARWGTGTTEQWLLTVVTGTPKFTVLANTLSGFTASSSVTIAAGGWHHIAGLFTGTSPSNKTAYVFVDGTQTGSVAVNNLLNPAGAATHVFIGKAADGNNMKGSIAESSQIIVNLTINTLADYQQIIAAGAAGLTLPEVEGMFNTGVVFYYPLQGDSPEVDLSGGHNNGTVNGTTITSHPGIQAVLLPAVAL